MDASRNDRIPPLIRPLDLYFANALLRHDRDGGDPLWVAAALISQRVGAGHINLSLREYAGKEIVVPQTTKTIHIPILNRWRERLLMSPVVGTPGAFAPLILEPPDRLYLHRYWNYEVGLARGLKAMVGKVSGVDLDRLKAGLRRLFPDTNGATDWQRVAAAVSVLMRLCIISGGPGTGKTTTVTRILALLAEQYPEGIRIALAAPTGKAAARLQESIAAAKKTLDLGDSVFAAIPSEVQTIHRMLGMSRRFEGFRYNVDNPLPADVVVLDEASMVDLSLMSHVVAALPPRARLILLGDSGQLASVEAGAVFDNLCSGEHPGYSRDFSAQLSHVCNDPVEVSNKLAGVVFTDCLVRLRKAYRYRENGAVARLIDSVREGDSEQCFKLLDDPKLPDVEWFPEIDYSDMRDFVHTIAMSFRAMIAEREVAPALDKLSLLGVLCALREGPVGAPALNQRIEHALAAMGAIHAGERWYHGCPVLVTRNDYNMDLFNGDIGVVIANDRGQLQAWFRTNDGELRGVPPNRLPSHETAFALTVHKSQGSEFDKVVCLFPAQLSPLLTRELIYTAISRARRAVIVHCPRQIFKEALSRRMQRDSGLRTRLRNKDAGDSC